jgi:hypothetical protein
VDGNANQQESKGLQPKQMKNKTDFIKYRGEWGEMAVGQNAQIDFVCYSIALAN